MLLFSLPSCLVKGSVALQLVADRDKATRSAALTMLASAYTMEGARLWRVSKHAF